MLWYNIPIKKFMGDDVILSRNREIRSLMNKQEKNLIMNSSICDVNKELKEVLNLFNGRIEKKNLHKVERIDEEVYKIIETRDAVEELRDTASLEWAQQDYQGKIKIPCQLCGSKKSEDKFTIINRINKNKLLVGSSCISKFPKIDNKLYGVPIAQISKLSKENPEKLKRIVEFNELYDGGTSIFYDWKNKYNEFDVIFPKSYDSQFDDILKQGRKIYNSYINGKVDKSELKIFKTCIRDFDYLYNKCSKFNEDKKNNKYICTKKIAKLLEDNNLAGTLSYIKEKEEIRRDIAKFVYHIDFVNRFKNDIQKTFSKYNIRLENLNSQRISFSYGYKNFEPIILENSLRLFTLKFSDIFYNINNFNQVDIFKGLVINSDYDNVYEFLGILDDILNRTGYYFRVDEELHSKKRVELHRRGFNKFCILNVDDVLTNFIEVLYLESIKAKTILLDYINRIDKWTDKSDIEKYNIGNIAEKWAK